MTFCLGIAAFKNAECNNLDQNAMFSVKEGSRHWIYVLVPWRNGGLKVALRKALQTAAREAPRAARLRHAESTRADAVGDRGAGCRTRLSEDHDRADRQNRTG